MTNRNGGALEAEQARIVAAFTDAGAELVDPPVLQSADTLLDLYGEDIRARAYTTRDPLAGELMLRPDFTVPVVQMHMEHRQVPSRYAYSGKVFRTQEMGAKRPSEYDQVGFEIFDGSAPELADAEVFALFSQVLKPLKLRAATGDMGVLLSAVQGLSTISPRKAALARHIWRPRRFHALLDRFGGRVPVPQARAALINRARDGAAVPDGAEMIGLRGADEIAARVAALVQDADAPPISAGEADLLDEIIELRDKAPAVRARLRDIATELPAIADAVLRIDARLEALSALGIDVAALDFEGGYGRTTMEYYDGFVFGFYAEDRPDLPPVATGGRYDALTQALGGADAVPAVGGVIRPALTQELAS